MSVSRATQAVAKFFEEVLGKAGRVVEVRPGDDGGWHVLMETVEESEYMRQFARPDLLVLYEVEVSKDCEVLSYSRKCVRERTTLETLA